MSRAPLAWDRRVVVWDTAMAAVRDVLRRAGLREVSTPCRAPAPAVEPYIEPIPAGAQWLMTSPELGMKRLLCRGSGAIFQLAHVFRGGEIGANHREEFHLLEWYRLGDDMTRLASDVEAIVAAVCTALGADAIVPRRWRRVGFFDVFAETTGVQLRGDEDAGALELAVSADVALHELVFRRHAPGPMAAEDLEVRTFATWLAVYSAWSMVLDEWLAGQGGVHLVDFPGPLAALAERAEVGGRSVARRMESYVGAVELANGYCELREAVEQRRRFQRVNDLRVACGQAALPLDDAFLADLAELGLPECVGIALGLDRLIMLACDAATLADIDLTPPR